MAGRVVLRIAMGAMSLTVLSGCALLPNSLTHREPESTHTMSDLCNFPKQFLATYFHATVLTEKLVGAPPSSMSRKLTYENDCDLESPDGELAASVSMSFSSVPNQPRSGVARTWTVDGVSVLQIPLPGTPDYPAKGAYIGMDATIGKWTGSFGFGSGDEATLEAAAKMVVSMTRTLKE
ncbi:hypothetical protein [Nocardia macrotermitis]|uniref:DUF3558 domain-containing protein n=1 Tax=Nocardia macrotermitis TaxID=2585198 RepID=A0A7K0D3W7_9NOCA|nr:hypothetical protein [Nocardia macrotermitis]MQY20433.1 hypothetical protein [Nocardia macrotermitis]